MLLPVSLPEDLHLTAVTAALLQELKQLEIGKCTHTEISMRCRYLKKKDWWDKYGLLPKCHKLAFIPFKPIHRINRCLPLLEAAPQLTSWQPFQQVHHYKFYLVHRLKMASLECAFHKHILLSETGRSHMVLNPVNTEGARALECVYRLKIDWWKWHCELAHCLDAEFTCCSSTNSSFSSSLVLSAWSGLQSSTVG